MYIARKAYYRHLPTEDLSAKMPMDCLLAHPEWEQGQLNRQLSCMSPHTQCQAFAPTHL
jgi:hypothetical protein